MAKRKRTLRRRKENAQAAEQSRAVVVPNSTKIQLSEKTTTDRILGLQEKQLQWIGYKLLNLQVIQSFTLQEYHVDVPKYQNQKKRLEVTRVSAAGGGKPMRTWISASQHDKTMKGWYLFVTGNWRGIQELEPHIRRVAQVLR